jgi:arginase family enzyme
MEEGLARRLVQVGVRTLNGHQREQAARFGVEIMEMRNWHISFDVDGLDPSCAPGVSHREPGGLTTRQALDVIHGVRARIVGADIVEYNPAADFQNMTATVCAKLLKEIAAQMLEEQ